MKTFRLIGMALVAVMMCLNFAACSSDDDEPTTDEGEIVTNQKRLAKVVEEDYTMEFTYDSKGRLASLIKVDDGHRSATTYTWNDKTIVAKRGDETTTYTLNGGGLVASSESSYEDLTFSYNSSNRLHIAQEDYDTYTFTWNSDKLTKVEADYWNRIMNYNGKTCKGYSLSIALMASNLCLHERGLMLTHPELFGCRSTQLPEEVSIMEDGDEKSAKLSYTLDKDGYIEKITETDSDGDKYTYTYIWK